MTLLAAPLRARTFPIAAASLAVVLISIAAYAGKIPAAFTAHGVDKILHATMAAVLTGCLARALRGRTVVAAFVVMTPLAIDEYLQRFSSRRSSDWGDLAADLAGALAVVAISALWKRRRLG